MTSDERDPAAAEKATEGHWVRPQTEMQREQTRVFIESLEEECRPYWEMVEVGDVLSRELCLTPELVVMYADGVEDFNPWYEAWKMNVWRIPGVSPFGSAIVPPLLLSHFILSVQFDHTKPFSIGSIHTFHDSEIIAPIYVGATVQIKTEAIEKFVKRERRYVRHRAEVYDLSDNEVKFRETRDILSL